MTMLIVLAGCSSNESSRSGQTSGADSSLLPDSELGRAKIYMYDGGRVTTEIQSERIIEYEGLDSSMSYGVHVTTYDSVGKAAGWVIADSAVVREKSGLLDLFGHVILVNERQTKLKTEYLHWNSENDRMETDEFVDIRRGEDWVTGWGLEADGRLNWYHIKQVKEVHGNLSNIGAFGEP
jgi:LPS export ABC transporter protein LptC